MGNHWGNCIFDFVRKCFDSEHHFFTDENKDSIIELPSGE